MPRGAKKTINQHNNRHENGIVAPGKRVTKQKSNGHINGSADGTFQPNAPPSPVPAPARSHVPDKRINGYKNAPTDFDEVDSRESGDLSEEMGPMVNGASRGVQDGKHRTIDVNAARSPAVHDSSPLSLALTILWSCPIGDTLAILIFLLSLPPTILTLTNTLFAILTFMPPTTSLSSFPTTFSDVFQGSSGAPSFATIIATDIIGLVMWLAIWTPVQVLALELAQAVVATTLGGGNSVKNKGSDHTIVCMGIVIVSHIARHKWIQNRFFGYDWTVRLASFSNIPLGPAEFLSDDIHTSHTFSSWFRLLITLHILVQGFVHVVRRWYARRGHTPPAMVSKKADLEPTTGSSTRSDPMSPANPTSSAQGALQEPTAKSSLPNARDTKEKSNKKKRRQGTYVRSQQPLWAAFAATKVTVCREFDQSKMLQEANGSNAKDSRNLGDAPFTLEESCVWITQIHLSSFSFEASYFPSKQIDLGSVEVTKPTIGVGVDRSKPFFVRVNGADWSSTMISSTSKGGSEDVSADQGWEGQVFGLSPSSSYICSFVRCEDGVEIFSASVSTPSSPPLDQETLATATPPLQPHRPSSPTSPKTTLLNSIAACEASKVEALARQKRSRKDYKAACASLKKETDIHNSKLAKIAVEDKAHHNRHMQWNQQTRQADEANAAMSTELDLISCIPEEEQSQWTLRKSDSETAQEQKHNAKINLSKYEESAEQEKAAFQSEEANTVQKRERLTARATKLQEQLQRLQSANAQGFDEKERREAELAAKAQDRRQSDERNQAHLNSFEKSIGIVQQSIQQAMQQIQGFSNAYKQQQIINATLDTTAIPGTEYPGTVIQPSTTSGLHFPALGPPEQAAASSKSASLRHDARPRSTSLRSNGNGGPNDFDDQDPAPPMPSTKTVGIIGGRKPIESASGNGIIRLSPTSKSGSPVWN
ncbi:MAG: hypothetical protein Q9195_004443 [Heterodermia aff. obscurata]